MDELGLLFKGIIDFLDNGKDMNIPYLIQGKNIYTKNDLIDALENRSSVAFFLAKDMINLAIDLTARAKEKSENFEAYKDKT